MGNLFSRKKKNNKSFNIELVEFECQTNFSRPRETFNKYEFNLEIFNLELKKSFELLPSNITPLFYGSLYKEYVGYVKGKSLLEKVSQSSKNQSFSISAPISLSIDGNLINFTKPNCTSTCNFEYHCLSVSLTIAFTCLYLLIIFLCYYIQKCSKKIAQI